jgi:hypothetical protein
MDIQQIRYLQDLDHWSYEYLKAMGFSPPMQYYLDKAEKYRWTKDWRKMFEMGW